MATPDGKSRKKKKTKFHIAVLSNWFKKNTGCSCKCDGHIWLIGTMDAGQISICN